MFIQALGLFGNCLDNWLCFHRDQEGFAILLQLSFFFLYSEYFKMIKGGMLSLLECFGCLEKSKISPNGETDCLDGKFLQMP